MGHRESVDLDFFTACGFSLERLKQDVSALGRYELTDEEDVTLDGVLAERAEAAACRTLELFDLTLADPKNRTRFREVARTRELFADHFFGDNAEASSSGESWDRYFLPFAIAAR